MLHSTDGLPGPVMVNKFGKAGDLQAQVVARPRIPHILEGDAVPPAHIHAQQRTGHRIEPGREDDDVHGIFGLGGANPRRGDPLDRRGLHIDQRDVRPIVGLEIVRIDRRPLRRIGMIDVRQDRRGLRILHDRADLALDEIGRGVVRRLAHQHVLERRAELQAAALPRRLVDRLALFGRCFDRLAVLDPEAPSRYRSHASSRGFRGRSA